MKTSKSQLRWLFVAICAFATASWGDGFRNPPEGANALGRIGGKVAYIDDASAIAQNPANITELREPSYVVALTLGYSRKDFRPDTGGKAESRDPWGYLPNVFVTYPLKDERFVAGIGVTTPFGRSTTFGKNSPIRYTSTYFAELRSVNINPTFAAKVHDRVSVGGGIDILWSDLTLKQMYPWALASGDPTAPDGRIMLEGDGVGFGYNAAVTWDVTDKQRLAVTYRSSINVDYDGDMKVRNIPPALPFPLSMATARSDFETDIDFPAVLAFGYGIELTEKLKVEANIEWIEHSVFNELDIDIDNNAVLLPSTTIPADWDDTWTYGLGASYQCSERWTARAGYMYLETPVPSRTMLPSIAEEDQSVVSVGMGYEKNGRRVDFAYAIGLFDGRRVSDNVNPAHNGKYEFDSHLFAVSYGQTF